MTGTTLTTRPKSEQAMEVTQLLRRYPGLAPAETNRLVATFQKLSILDVALLTTDEFVRPRLDAFRRDHKRELRPPFWYYLVVLLVPVIMATAMAWGVWLTVTAG